MLQAGRENREAAASAMQKKDPAFEPGLFTIHYQRWWT
jgi:hypothetical protein